LLPRLCVGVCGAGGYAAVLAEGGWEEFDVRFGADSGWLWDVWVYGEGDCDLISDGFDVAHGRREKEGLS
jgi:hypothetical protein